MRRPVVAIFVSVLAAACVGGVALTEDPPPARPPRAGNVTGTVTPASKVARIRLVSRVTGKTYAPKSFDRKTGRFVFEDLPGDAQYDVSLRTTDGRNIEGIDLEFVDHRMVRLAAARRKQLALPPEPAHEFSMDDVKELETFIRDMRDFMELRRILYLQGWGKRAVMLLELMRTREHYDGQGRYVWRVELWYFEHHYGGWEKVKNQERFLHRQRVSPGAWRKFNIEYYPQLTARVEANGYAKAVTFRIPDKPDPSRGRPAGTKPELKTATHIRGLDIKPAPTTAPAAAPPK